MMIFILPPAKLLTSFDTNPSGGATVTRPQTLRKPHRLLNNRLAAVFVRLLEVQWCTFLQGRPGQSRSLDQRRSSPTPAPAPAVVRQILRPLTTQPEQLGVPEGRKTKEKHNSKCQDTAWWELSPLVCLRSCWTQSSKGKTSGKLFRFPLQTLRGNSETSFSLLRLT